MISYLFSQKLLILDVDDTDIVLTVLSPPRHGRLVFHEEPPQSLEASRVTLQQLNEGRLAYSHDGSDSVEDAVTLQISDTSAFVNVLLKVGQGCT